MVQLQDAVQDAERGAAQDAVQGAEHEGEQDARFEDVELGAGQALPES